MRDVHTLVVTDNLTGEQTASPYDRCPECNGRAYGPCHAPWRRSERIDGVWVTDSHCRCGRLRHHSTFYVDTEPVDLLDLIGDLR